MNPKILVAGIGNIFLGDDSFGVEVAQKLLQLPWPEGVRVADYGIRGFDLTYALMDGYDAAILVDAVPRGDAPGTLYVIEPDLSALPEPEPVIETHGMNPMRVLAMVRSMGGAPRRVLVLGCEPSPDSSEESMGLSGPVAAAVDEAVNMVISLVQTIVKEHQAVAVLKGERT